jgi:hypothetical protein
MSSLTDLVAGLDREGLAAFFGGSDAVEITRLIRETSDADLAGLIERDDFRQEGITAILQRFPEFAAADRQGWPSTR